MTSIRTQYLDAAAAAVELLGHDAVAAAWTERSALEGFTVGGLAAHLAAQVTTGAQALEADFSGKPVVGLFDHYEQASWLAADIGNESNTAIRDGGERTAESGPAGVREQAQAALESLREGLPGLSPDAIGGNPWWPYATSFDDLLTTRIMEIVVHSDDVAASVGIATPEVDADVFDTAMRVLTRLASARHGQAALVRALARAERAPSDISAL